MNTQTMTAAQVVAQADQFCPNGYSLEQKLQWLGELEGRIHADVYLATPEEMSELGANWTGDLSVSWPHSGLYLQWLLAMINQADGEIELYQNRMQTFNELYGDFVRWYIRHYDPAHKDLK